MANANRYDDVVAGELDQLSKDLGSEHYPGETTDELAYRLIALAEDELEQLEARIAHLENVRATIKALIT